jgi:hypothetical protein
VPTLTNSSNFEAALQIPSFAHMGCRKRRGSAPTLTKSSNFEAALQIPAFVTMQEEILLERPEEIQEIKQKEILEKNCSENHYPCHAGQAVLLPTARLDWLECRIPKAAELLREVARTGGEALNATEIGRRMGISCHAVLHRLALLENAGLIRTLPSLASRRPHVLLRDCALHQELCGTPHAILRACLTERIAQALLARSCSASFAQWEAGRVRRIELVVCTKEETIGFKLVEGRITQDRDVIPLRLGVKRGVISRGFLLSCDNHFFLTSRVIIGASISNFLEHIDAWLACRSLGEARELMRRCLALESRRPRL